VLSVLIAVLVLGWGSGEFIATPAHAQGCLAPGDVRSAVRNGRAKELSRIIGSMEGAAGQVLSLPQLCNDGDRLFYELNILGKGGKLRRMRIDAQNGRELGR
jgi:hypothetical protein